MTNLFTKYKKYNIAHRFYGKEHKKSDPTIEEYEKKHPIPVLNANETYANINMLPGTAVSLDGSNVEPSSPSEFSFPLIWIGLNRLKSAFRFVSPLNLVLLLLIIVIWGFILFDRWLFVGPKEFEAGTNSFSFQFDGQRRNDFTTLDPSDGRLIRNFQGSGIICDLFGFGCNSDITGVLSRDVRRPYFVDDIAAGGFNILKYRKVADGYQISLGSALAKNACKGLTLKEAKRFYCDRDIISQSWYKTATPNQ